MTKGVDGVDNGAYAAERKPATAARMYDYFLGGIHNFPADRDAARRVIEQFPFVPAAARANRAFTGRAVRYLIDQGIRQFLDLGSGIPTAGSVHEIAQEAAPDARVVYVDVDPVAVAEGLEILQNNDLATTIRADVRTPEAIFAHPQVRKLLDPAQPTGVLLAAVLQFVPDDAEAFDLVTRVVGGVAPGSFLILAHASHETFVDATLQKKLVGDVYTSQTTALAKLRTHADVRRFFDDNGVELVEPGVVWTPQWRPEPDKPEELADEPKLSASWVAVGRIGQLPRT
jgi:hypothetical protein